MAKSKSVKSKKRGRPATGKDPFVGIRLPAPLIEKVETWAARHDAASRSDAIRRLVETGLARVPPTVRRNPKAASKASDMAGKEIDRLADPLATDDERESRKRRLLKGPKEFRDIRSDHPTKAKR